MIEGVIVKDLVTHADERGFFREAARFDDFGIEAKQISHAYRATGIANGWHIHRRHHELFYVPRGILRLCLKDCRSEDTLYIAYPYDGIESITDSFPKSSTPDEYAEIILGEFNPKSVLVPPMVAHAYKILSADCDIVYVATATYETSRHDEGRIQWDYWPEHDWTRSTEVR